MFSGIGRRYAVTERRQNMAEVKITSANFEQEVINSDIPVLVDFWATWCGPCKMIAPSVTEIAEENEGKIKVGKVNVDEESELAMRFKIASIPTLLLFENGQVKNMLVGYRPKIDIEEMLK